MVKLLKIFPVAGFISRLIFSLWTSVCSFLQSLRTVTATVRCVRSAAGSNPCAEQKRGVELNERVGEGQLPFVRFIFKMVDSYRKRDKIFATLQYAAMFSGACLSLAFSTKLKAGIQLRMRPPR
jgi:hypothetical protein